jgi:murein DD-endopeptidase MepM/ murein hydrolase activator NlpD
MKKILCALLPIILSSCAAIDPAPIEHSNKFMPIQSKGKDLRVRIIKDLNSDMDEEDTVSTRSINDLKDGDEIDGFTVRVKKDDARNDTKRDIEEIRKPADNPKQSLDVELEKEFAHDRAELSDNSKLSEISDSEHTKDEVKEINEDNVSDENFTILPAQGKIIKNFRKGSEGFEAIIFSRPKGSIIKSVSEGIVVYSGFDPKFGNIVIVAFQDFQIAYGYVKDIVVKKGSKVRVGDIVGYIGDIINSKNSGLYFAIRKNNIAIDPETLLPLNQ